jgi:hypothetical protein
MRVVEADRYERLAVSWRLVRANAGMSAGGSPIASQILALSGASVSPGDALIHACDLRRLPPCLHLAPRRWSQVARS